MPNIQEVLRETQDIFKYLVENEITFIPNTIVVTGNRLSWDRDTEGTKFLIERGVETPRSYLHWLATSSYSAVLNDGSLLQVAYEFEGGEPIYHRLAYIPSPLLVDFKQEPPIFPLDEYMSLLVEDGMTLLMRSPIRFDFDKKNASASHPNSHLTFNSQHCRIGCVSPLRVSRFIYFIFKNFYPDIFKDHTYLQTLPLDGWFPNREDFTDTSEMHFHWPRQPIAIS